MGESTTLEWLIESNIRETVNTVHESWRAHLDKGSNEYFEEFKKINKVLKTILRNPLQFNWYSSDTLDTNFPEDNPKYFIELGENEVWIGNREKDLEITYSGEELSKIYKLLASKR